MLPSTLQAVVMPEMAMVQNLGAKKDIAKKKHIIYVFFLHLILFDHFLTENLVTHKYLFF